MKKALLILVFSIAVFACNKDEENCDCEGQFINPVVADTIHEPTDCKRTPPAEGYYFDKCIVPTY